MGIDGPWSKFLKINALLLRRNFSTHNGRIIECRLNEVRIIKEVLQDNTVCENYTYINKYIPLQQQKANDFTVSAFAN